MIIDADCHINSSHLTSIAMTADDLVATMDRAQVERALVWLAPPYNRSIEAENRAVCQGARCYPDRLLPFGWANPRLGLQPAQDTIAKCLDEYGFLGIKFNGAQDDYVIDDPELSLPCIAFAARFGRPIAFHIGADSYGNTHPTRLGHIAELFPKLPLLMVHMGGVGKPSLARAAIEVAQRHANVTLIGSESSTRDILQAIAILGPSRVCYGSDSPFEPMHVEVARYRALLGDLSPVAQAEVMGGNIARVLGV
jgi:hypothetical protein